MEQATEIIKCKCGELTFQVERHIPDTIEAITDAFGRPECLFMLREAIRTRIQRKGYWMLKAINDGKAGDAATVEKVAAFVEQWGPPGPLPRTKLQTLVEDLGLVAKDLSDDQVQYLVNQLKNRKKA